MWHVDQLLGNYREITIQQSLLSNGSAKKHVSTTREYNNNGSSVFYAVRVEML
jgi:hypothetical protein